MQPDPANSPLLSVRRAVAGDAAAILDLTRSAYAKWIPLIGREVTPATQDYDRIVRDDLVDLLFANGDLVALIWVQVKPDHLLIESLAVAPAHQGRGHGDRMLAHAEALAVGHGLGLVRLYTNSRFASNIVYYQRRGYCIEREEIFCGGVKVHLSKRIGDGA